MLLIHLVNFSKYLFRMNFNTNAHSQAHLQFAPANAKAKNCKRARLSANAFLPTRKNKIRTVLN